VSQKKKPRSGESNVKSGSKRTGSLGQKSNKTTNSKTTSKRLGARNANKGGPSTKEASPEKQDRPLPRPRAQPSSRRPATETAPSLAEAPRRKPLSTKPLSTKPLSTKPLSTKPLDLDASVSDSDEGQLDGAPNSEHPVEENYDAENEPDDSRFSEAYGSNPMDFDMLGIGSPVFPPGGFNLDVDVEDSDTSETAPGTPWADDPSVEMRIREIEERLDGLMASNPHEDLDHAPPSEHIAVAPASADTAVDAAREVLESDYYRKKWGRTSLRDLASEIDDFGMDPAFEQKLRPALDFMFKRYFRVEVEGVRNVPTQGRAVVVANHSGALPFDGVMLREAIRQRHPGRDDLRWLAEDFSFYLPFLGVTLNRLGAVRACPENAERLLGKGHLVGVFPEGAEGIKKLYRDRYRLQRFGRGGFVRLCLKTQSPIVPCAIIGAEETNPILYRFDNLSKLLGLDYLPITPTFPLLGPLGLLPAPTKWRIVFGEPISVEEYGPQAAQDHVLVGRLAERVRSSINDLLETALRRRKSIWL
jgi:1-acyl-sn-glycerol-3-phosphate acyltransferase